MLSFVPFTFGQRQADNWYFGNNAALNFSNCNPVPTFNSSMNAEEGVACISDANGNLLFYTDGITVWNKQHAIMQNGTGLFGAVSSTQSGIIVPQPGNDSIYFIFTVDNESGNHGLCYSIVNINHFSGLGEVINKNTHLLNNANEKIAAISHHNNLDYWVITRQFNSNNYYSWVVSATGVNPSPVISPTTNNIGSAHPMSRGYLRISSDGTKLACTLVENSFSELSNFNNQTGVVSNTFKLNNFPFFALQYTLSTPYGVEFSPDNKLMYVSWFFNNTSTSNYFLSQYNVNSYDSTSIANSVVLIDSGGSVINPNHYNHGALQLAKNGKIYVAEYYQTFLSVINNPNVIDAGCDFQIGAVSIAPKKSLLGLPNFIQSYFNPNYATYDFLHTEDCTRTETFTVNSTFAYDSIRWYFNGLSGLPNNTSTLATTTHTYASDGNYDVRLIVYKKYGCENRIDTILKNIAVGNRFFDLGSNKLICVNETTILNASVNAAISYLWNTSEGSPSISVSQPGLYYCDVDFGGCIFRDSIYVYNKPSPIVNLGKDTTICEGQSLLLSALNPNSTYTWQDGTTVSTYSVSADGEYVVSVNLNGCITKDTINVNYKFKPIFSLGDDQPICSEHPILLKPILNPLWQLLWNDGSSFNSYTITQPGIYSLSATNECGVSNDEIKISQGVCDIYIPTVFTPNGDGANDFFKVLGTGSISDFNLQVYNRYGQKIFETRDKNSGWDGKWKGYEQNDGSYVWMLRYKKESRNLEEQLKGTVFLLR